MPEEGQPKPQGQPQLEIPGQPLQPPLSRRQQLVQQLAALDEAIRRGSATNPFDTAAGNAGNQATEDQLATQLRRHYLRQLEELPPDSPTIP